MITTQYGNFSAAVEGPGHRDQRSLRRSTPAAVPHELIVLGNTTDAQAANN